MTARFEMLDIFPFEERMTSGPNVTRKTQLTH